MAPGAKPISHYILVGFVILAPAEARAACPTFHTLTNGTTADASQVMDNYDYILNCPNFLGRVGIGTSSPNGILTVGDGTASDRNALVLSSDAPRLYFQTYTTVSGHVPWKISAQDSVSGGLTIAYGNSAVLDATSASYTDALTILHNGDIGIGTNSPGYTLHVNGSVAGVGAYVNLSDVRLKKNIATIANALQIVDGLHGVRFDWKSPSERTIGKDIKLPIDRHQVGFIAQDVDKLLPEAVSVSQDANRVMSVAESKVTPILVEAIKELEEKNTKQEMELQAEKKRTADLERRLTAIEGKVGGKLASN